MKLDTRQRKQSDSIVVGGHDDKKEEKKVEQKVWAPDVTCYVSNQCLITLPDGREINCFAFLEDFRFDHVTDFEVAAMFHQICKDEMRLVKNRDVVGLQRQNRARMQ